MIETRQLTAWLRPLVGFIALMGLLALSACGGGNGSPQSVLNQPIPVVADLVVFPSNPTIYAKVPSALTISGGTPPYRAFSSNTVVLPVAQSVPANSVPLLASPVSTITRVTITIQDSGGQSVQNEVTVLPELVTPPPPLVVLPTTLEVFPNTPTQLLVNGGVAPFRAFSSNPAILPVTLTVTGNIVPLLANAPAANTTVTVTVQDAVGQTAVVEVLVHANSAGPPQPTPPPLSVLPTTLDVYLGVPTQLVVSGGTAPYRAFSSNSAVLPVTLTVTGNIVPLVANAVAADTTVTVTLQDATGQTVAATVRVHASSANPPPTPPPLSVLPSSIDVTAGTATQVTINGGVAPYRAFSSNPGVLPVTQNVTENTVPLLAGNVTANTPVVLTIQDAAAQTVTVNVLVRPAAAPPALAVLPPSLDAYPGVPTQLLISGGTGPYRAVSSNPAVLPVTLAVTGNVVPLIANPVNADATVTVTIQDATAQTVVATIRVHASSVNPPPALSVLPTAIDVFAGVSTQVTIFGGLAPYRAFSSNPGVLPVTQNVNGNTVPLLAGSVAADTPVNLTIQDAAGQTVVVIVTVHSTPATPPPALIVLPTSVEAYTGISTQVSILGGVAPYRAFSSNSAVLPVTEAVVGGVVPLLAGTVAADTTVVVTIQDSAGQRVTVNVLVHPRPSTPPTALTVLPSPLEVVAGNAAQLTISGGVAPYRAFSSNSAVLPVTTDVPGNTVTLLAAPVTANTNVNIIIQDSVGQTVTVVVTVRPQSTSPAAPLVVLPNQQVEVFPGIAAPLTISGGVAPYRAFTSNNAVLPVSTIVSGSVVNLLANNVTINTPVIITIQDAVGQTVVVPVTVHPTPTTPAGPLSVLPPSITISKGVPGVLTISGGLAPYFAYSFNPGALPVTQQVTGNSITLIAGGVNTNTNVTVLVQDSAGQTVNVAVTILADPATPPPTLVILPASITLFSGTPASLTVSGGTPPYRAFTTNPAVLPVAQAVVASAIPLFAAPVTVDTTVTVSVLDADNKTATATVLVRPAPLLNSLTVTPNRTDCGTQAVCTGQTAIAQVTVSSPGGGGIPNRQVRFDVVAGDYAIQLPSGAIVSSQTVTTDASGVARVVLLATVNAPTQVALISATDLTSTNQVTANFIIAQFTNGTAILSVLPTTVALTGPDATHCSDGVPVTYYVFGGTPPYRVVASLPTFVSLTGSPIAANGGFFTATTNGNCFAQETFIVTDATGRTVTATLSNSLGAGGGGGGGGIDCGLSPPAPQCLLSANPPAFTLTACTGPGSTSTVQVTGGTRPYAIAILPLTQTWLSTATSNPATGAIVVTRLGGPPAPQATVRVSSAAGGQLVDIPVNVSGTAAGSCSGGPG